MKLNTRILALIILLATLALSGCLGKYRSRDWGNYDLLKQKAPCPDLPSYNGKQVPYDEYLRWVYWGEHWFRNETFGNERVWTDVVGFLNGQIEVPDGAGGWQPETAAKYLLRAIDRLDGVQGNLYSGNGGPEGTGFTNDLVITFPPGSRLDGVFPIPERLHTGLDVEAGAAWPIGIVPVATSDDLPYLLDPSRFADGPDGIGPHPTNQKYRVGLSCALCHYSLDVDWDGKPDLRSAKPNEPTPNSAFEPQHAWAISNQDVHLGWIFALAQNTLGGFENSGPPGKTSLDDARAWARYVLENYEKRPEEIERDVDRGFIVFPRGYADDTPDGLHNPLQFPSLFTHLNWPFNFDGVMLNASDRNNNVWTTGLDPTQLVALCNDRGGKLAKLMFWEKQGMYSVLSAEEYADIMLYRSPAVLHDSSKLETLRNDILGYADGVPGLLNNESTVLIKGVPGALPKSVLNHEENKKHNRVHKPKEFGSDGGKRKSTVGMLGTRVITSPAVRQQYGIDTLAAKYGLNADEFETEAVSLMLDWVEPPPNRTALLEKARQAGLVHKGYEIFKQQGCVSCHAGPMLSDNQIIRLEQIGTEPARAKATEPIQKFLTPKYDPATGKAVSNGVFGFLSGLFGKKKIGYKVVTLRYLWGSAPYLHDGGVGVTLRPGSEPAGDDLQALLKRPEDDKLFGVGQILVEREKDPASYLRPNAALSLQAVLLNSEREKVIAANQQATYPVAGTFEQIPMTAMHIQGIGHEFWIDDEPGGDMIAALVAFLLALDDNPGEVEELETRK